jgi:hypothetical protein
MEHLSMRTRFGLLGGVLVLAFGAGIAALAYQAGVSQGAATAATAGSVVVIDGGSWGFGIFGVLFGLFILFVLARIVIGVTFGAFGRGHGRGPWAHGGYPGRGAWTDAPADGPGAGGHGAGSARDHWGDREAFVAAMHRHLHERDAAAGSAADGPAAAAGSVAAAPERPTDPTTPARGAPTGA